MSSSVDASLYWQLPGPRDFLLDLKESLQEFGSLQQLLVAVPDRFAPPGLAARIADFPSQRRAVLVEVTEDCVESVAGTCLEAVGAPLPESVPRVGDLMGPHLAHHLLVIDATAASPSQLDELLVIVNAMAAMAHNARAEDAPLQIAAVVSGTAVSNVVDMPRLAVRWWWGRLSRLDTRLLMREALAGKKVHETLLAAIAEVAAFDLGLALALLSGWDGDLTSLVPHLFRRADGCPELLAAPRPVRLLSTERPPAAVLDSWAAGGCDRWDGETIAWHPAAAAKQDPTQLQRAMWRAQAATVLPLLEEQRELVALWLKRGGHEQRLRQLCGNTAEIGPICHYMRTNGMKTRPQMTLVEWLLQARNQVAHLECLTAADMERGIQLIAETRL